MQHNDLYKVTDDHLMLVTAQELAGYHNHLFDNGLKYFFNLQVKQHSQFIELGNSPEVLKYAFRHWGRKTYQAIISRILSHSEEIFFPYDRTQAQIDLAVRYGVGQSVYFLYDHGDSKKIWSFSSQVGEEGKFLNYFVNHIDDFRRMIDELNNQLRPVEQRLFATAFEFDGTQTVLLEPLNLQQELSSREYQCLYYLVRGLTSREIGAQLNISHRTVESYLENIKNKFNLLRRSELIRFYFEHHLAV